MKFIVLNCSPPNINKSVLFRENFERIYCKFFRAVIYLIMYNGVNLYLRGINSGKENSTIFHMPPAIMRTMKKVLSDYWKKEDAGEERESTD